MENLFPSLEKETEKPQPEEISREVFSCRISKQEDFSKIMEKYNFQLDKNNHIFYEGEEIGHYELGGRFHVIYLDYTPQTEPLRRRLKEAEERQRFAK